VPLPIVSNVLQVMSIMGISMSSAVTGSPRSFSACFPESSRLSLFCPGGSGQQQQHQPKVQCSAALSSAASNPDDVPGNNSGLRQIQKIVSLGMLFFCTTFNYTILVRGSLLSSSCCAASNIAACGDWHVLVKACVLVRWVPTCVRLSGHPPAAKPEGLHCGDQRGS